MSDPSQHEAHDMPLVSRIIDAAVREWLNRRTATALAATGDLDDYERGVRQGIEQMRHLHLDDYWYALTPKITEELERAGRLHLAL